MNKKILYVFTGNHPVHRKFAETITNNIIKFSWNLPKGYDIYFFEGEYAKPILMRKIGLLPKKSKIFVLFADPRLYYLKKKIRFSYKTKKISKMNILKKKIAIYLLKKIDASICEGSFNADLLKEFGCKKQIKIIYPFISDEKYEKLKKVKPNFRNYNILFVGNGPDYYVKGIEIMLKVFTDINKDFPKSKLFILGENWDAEKYKTKNVYFEGKKDISHYLKNSSLLIHLGQGEGFGINVIEAMLAGVPAIVSEFTGAKDIAYKLNKNWVLPLEAKTIKTKIEEYFKMDKERKLNYSKKAKNIGENFKQDNKLNEFKKTFLSLK